MGGADKNVLPLCLHRSNKNNHATALHSDLCGYNKQKKHKMFTRFKREEAVILCHFWLDAVASVYLVNSYTSVSGKGLRLDKF